MDFLKYLTIFLDILLLFNTTTNQTLGQAQGGMWRNLNFPTLGQYFIGNILFPCGGKFMIRCQWTLKIIASSGALPIFPPHSVPKGKAYGTSPKGAGKTEVFSGNIFIGNILLPQSREV
jgi:hypothetical protein